MKDFSALKRKQAYHVCINVEKFMKKKLISVSMLFFLYEYVSFHFVLNFYDWAYFPVIMDYNLFDWYYWLS